MLTEQAQFKPQVMTMDMQRFSEENRRRCEHPKGFNHALDSWSVSDWFTAVMGELGEAANVAKKLNRVRDGIPGNKETEEELRVKLGRELADTYIYLDLLCQRVGVDLSACVRQAFFEKSIQIGYERWDITNPHTRRWLQENLPNELASQLARETTLPAEQPRERKDGE